MRAAASNSHGGGLGLNYLSGIGHNRCTMKGIPDDDSGEISLDNSQSGGHHLPALCHSLQGHNQEVAEPFQNGVMQTPESPKLSPSKSHDAKTLSDDDDDDNDEEATMMKINEMNNNINGISETNSLNNNNNDDEIDYDDGFDYDENDEDSVVVVVDGSEESNLSTSTNSAESR